jgi:ferredoxin-type protein NapF
MPMVLGKRLMGQTSVIWMSDKEHNMSRRGLLRGDWFKAIRKRGRDKVNQKPTFSIKKPDGQAKRGVPFIHRPPHAVPESEFVAGCTRCDACIDVCPPHAIFRIPESDGLLAGTPTIDPTGQPCIVCEDMPCVESCEAGVLRMDAPVAMALAKINTDTCLAYHGTVCTVCVDQCPVEDCMTMEGGRPRIDAQSCTGCGVCLYVCPVEGSAIDLLPT